MSNKVGISIHRVTVDYDLAVIARSIVGAEWGADNQMSDYDEKVLRDIAANPDYILLVAYVDDKPAGLALAMKLLKPDGDHWLYVDEMDTHPDFRRQGIGSQLMKTLIGYAKDWGLEEVWVGTEPDNTNANLLYKSLNPAEVETFVGYTYKNKLNP